MRGDFFTSILKSVTNKFRQNEVQITLKMFYLKLRVNAYETKNTAANKIEHIFFHSFSSKYFVSSSRALNQNFVNFVSIERSFYLHLLKRIKLKREISSSTIAPKSRLL